MLQIIVLLYVIGILLTFGILMGGDLGDEFALIFGSIFFPALIIITIGVKIGEFISNKAK